MSSSSKCVTGNPWTSTRDKVNFLLAYKHFKNYLYFNYNGMTNPLRQEMR
jgi:hypothetical protein